MAAERRPLQVQAARKGVRHSEAFLSWDLVKRVVCAAIIARFARKKRNLVVTGGLDGIVAVPSEQAGEVDW